MLCTLCQNIQFKRYPELAREEKIDLAIYCDEWPPRDYDEEEILSNDQAIVAHPYESFYFHHRNLESLRKAADDGCHFCYQIFYGLLETTVLDNIENSSERLYLNLQPPCIHPHEREHLYHGDLDVRLGAESLGRMRLRDLDNFAKFALSNQNTEHNSSTGSSMNLDLAASWLHDCANYHENCCHPQVESVLPLRVLDIGDLENPQRIFLSVGDVGKDRIGSYAALSYCWGKSENPPLYITTNDNLKQQQEAVDTSMLPKTFTDAVFVCRHLGIRFLWIDSLCIIQDNQSDWEMQSKKMGDIYSNATLTLSAAFGENSHAGLFVDRDPRKTYPCTLNFQYPKEDACIKTTAFLTCRDSCWPETAYLDTRGWTFQEKYLSPRTLRFSKTEMHWICASSNASEGLPMGLHPLTNKSDYDKYIKADKHGALPTQVNMVQRYHWWYQAMEMYSHRVFTFESDRLTALSGLALKFQGLGDEFLLGLWKLDLAHGLAWRFGGQNKQPAMDTSPTSPIPSWSWTSRPGNIITYSDSDSIPGSVMELNESITLFHTPKGSLQHSFIEFLSVESMPPATGLSASFTNGSLRLRGLVLKVSPTESSAAYDSSSWSTSAVSFRYSYPLTGQICKQFWGSAFYDEPVTKEDKLYCLPLSVLPSERQGMSTRPGDTNAKARQRIFSDISMDELVSMQTMSLELGVGMLPTMTWCAGPIPCCTLERNDSLSCLMLKIVDAKEMKFRRVGYLEIMDGQLFEGVVPITLEII